MKRLLSSIILLILAISTIQAQDIIYKIDGTKIEANIIKVTDELLQYKSFNNQDGPTFEINIKTVKQIILRNGEIYNFNQQQTTEDRIAKAFSQYRFENKDGSLYCNGIMVTEAEASSFMTPEQYDRFCRNKALSTTGIVFGGIGVGCVIPGLVLSSTNPKMSIILDCVGAGSCIIALIMITSASNDNKRLINELNLGKTPFAVKPSSYGLTLAFQF